MLLTLAPVRGLDEADRPFTARSLHRDASRAAARPLFRERGLSATLVRKECPPLGHCCRHLHGTRHGGSVPRHRGLGRWGSRGRRRRLWVGAVGGGVGAHCRGEWHRLTATFAPLVSPAALALLLAVGLGLGLGWRGGGNGRRLVHLVKKAAHKVLLLPRRAARLLSRERAGGEGAWRVGGVQWGAEGACRGRRYLGELLQH